MRFQARPVKLEATAFAKVNLHLRILAPRGDEFHEVRTLLQTVHLCDRVRAAPALRGVVEVTVDPPGIVSSGEENLVVRAARALQRMAGIDDGAKIELSKRIPVAAGLGGGSSDAAATLVLLDALWNLQLRPSELLAVAAELGSDVPFFLVGGLALATGRGEIVQPLPDLPALGVLVCTPPIEISTPVVYARYVTGSRLTSPGSDVRVEAFVADARDGECAAPPWQELENDLEPVVIEGWPVAGRAVDALKSLDPLHAAITGSGASSYAVFRDLEEARVAAKGLEDIWNVDVTSTVGRKRGRPRATRCENREEFA
jgi:4-diphosphocytidyl-2C-methyl-D-erythritol kinase